MSLRIQSYLVVVQLVFFLDSFLMRVSILHICCYTNLLMLVLRKWSYINTKSFITEIVPKLSLSLSLDKYL